MTGAVHAAGGAPAAADGSEAPGRIGAGPAADAASGIVHGSCVAFGGAGVLILGPSGSGKSALALALIGLGAALVADDRVSLSPVPASGPHRHGAGAAASGTGSGRGIAVVAPPPGTQAAGGGTTRPGFGLPDDPPELAPRGSILARAPAGLPRWIEARGIGLLHAPVVRQAALALVVDLGRPESERLPPRRRWHWQGAAVDCVHAVATGHFPAAIRHYVLWGRAA